MQRRIGIATLSALLLALIGTACNSADRTATGEKNSTTAQDSLMIPLRTPDGKPARFAFRSGIVEMQYQGDYKGIRRLVFDDYGLREWKMDSAVPATALMALVPPYQLSIITPEYYGTVDLRSNSGQRTHTNAFEDYLASPEAKTTSFGELALSRSSGERLADTMIQGKYLCRVYKRSYPEFTQMFWVWGGVPIREKMTMTKSGSGSYLIEPVSVETGVSIPDTLFSFSKEYDMLEIPSK